MLDKMQSSDRMKQFPILDGRYQVIQKLSAGGFGLTYLAKDTRRPNHPLCVAKELRHEHQSNLKILRLFHQEAEMLETLGEHSQIPKLLAAFSEANRWYLIQEYIDGITLADELVTSDGERLRKSESEVVNVLRDVLTALAFVHQQNVVHRDIKPANLIRRSKDNKMVLIDFGAVKELTGSQINQQGTVSVSVCVVSRGYTPCEQYQGKVSAASDIYALGVTAIEALTGQCPKRLEPESVLSEWQWQQYAQVSSRLAAFLSKMVRVDRQYRFQNARAALSALERFTAEKPLLIVKPTLLSPPPTKQRDNRTLVPTLTGSQTIPSRSQAHKLQKQSTSVPFVRSNTKRRDTLKFLGFSAAGMLAALLGQQFVQSSLNDSEPKTSAVEPGPTPTITPTPDPPVSPKPMTQSLSNWNLEAAQVNPQGQVISTPVVQVEYFDEPHLLNKLGDALPLRMVKIPAGEFVIGSPPDELERLDDEDQQPVSISSFFMGAFAVTQMQYAEIMNDKPSSFSENGADLPVESVSWLDAKAFCEKLSDLTDSEYRLPSEEEWEYACRAGTTTPFAFGETITMDIANYNGFLLSGEGAYQGEQIGTYKGKTVAVNAFFPNAFGLYNMHGNVGEWCQSDYLPYDGSTYDRKAGWGVPKRGGTEITKVYRGGHWRFPVTVCRSAARRSDLKNSTWDSIGFRVVCTLLPQS